MKTEELMVGDWVYQAQFVDIADPNLGHGWKPVKVTLIPFDKDCFIEPIPLKADILNQVGFKIDRDSAITTHLSFEEEEGGLIVFENPKGEFFLYTEYYDEEFSEYWTVEATKIVLRYVHELQHVLRIWGIEKKIVL